MFISQNSDTTPIISRAYDFDEGIIESGYPRNDELRNPDPARVAEIRARLGIPEGNTAVMYAPTWREEGQDVELLNVVELSDRLGPEFTFLQRGHVRTLELADVVEHDNVIDVSTYPQINDLYLAADLLITDYSSMMFDYSVTRQPDDLLHARLRRVHQPQGARRLLRPRGDRARTGRADARRGRRPARLDRLLGTHLRGAVRGLGAPGSTTPTTGMRPSGRSTRCSRSTPSQRSRQLVERYDLEAGTGEDG